VLAGTGAARRGPEILVQLVVAVVVVPVAQRLDPALVGAPVRRRPRFGQLRLAHARRAFDQHRLVQFIGQVEDGRYFV